jgi:hypothetical protein
MAVEYDSPWKELLECFFDLVVELFFPKLHGEIDWSQGYESQETELRKILPEAAVGKRTADALIRDFSHPSREAGGGHDPRYVHVEVQCQPQEDFPNRIDDYNSLFKLKLGHPVVSILILGDNDPKWKPDRYLFRCGEFEKRVSFPTVKLLKYRRRQCELEEHANPVALLVLAHLLALDTQVEDQARAEGTLRLLPTARGTQDGGGPTLPVRSVDRPVGRPPCREPAAGVASTARTRRTGHAVYELSRANRF